MGSSNSGGPVNQMLRAEHVRENARTSAYIDFASLVHQQRGGRLRNGARKTLLTGSKACPPRSQTLVAAVAHGCECFEVLRSVIAKTEALCSNRRKNIRLCCVDELGGQPASKCYLKPKKCNVEHSNANSASLKLVVRELLKTQKLRAAVHKRISVVRRHGLLLYLHTNSLVAEALFNLLGTEGIPQRGTICQNTPLSQMPSVIDPRACITYNDQTK
ncbi:hypothetical protein M409DRAFT_54185 [Zasmidium cellare ATCC 36951]|uniref:Uncharacterized protein n=1 Tax=Zasmidium cellare ATCC 36951 TaxID=1080233 RepID=A0A6A6CQ54_ZASCE|nr:uncharacterized protein M409DRAFT_54185 [Zasmidium cellare ATCC 36951]KAF2167596.1 hypothetical protein M409DRAFT_54185 [Zasmidium cellare ATCC 36951]